MEDKKTIQLPNGSALNVRIPTAPVRNVTAHVIDKCKFHIPLKFLEQQISLGKWPVTGILKQDLGGTKIPKEELWTGTEAEWKEHLRETESEKTGKRVTKLKALRKAQAGLKKLSADEWEALKCIFIIQPQFAP